MRACLLYTSSILRADSQKRALIFRRIFDTQLYEDITQVLRDRRAQDVYKRQALNMPNRLTWIAPDGTVRYDNQSNAADMENHLGREEIAQASETGTGFSRRFSQTLLEEQLYCAQRLEDGSYLRLAATQSSLAGSLWRMGGALSLIHI